MPEPAQPEREAPEINANHLSLGNAAGFLLVFLLIGSTAVVCLLVLFEYSGAASRLTRRVASEPSASIAGTLPKFVPHKTAYYGSPLESDPYNRFKVQHLHPYYIFSLPWREADRANANNEIASVGPDGFRNSTKAIAEKQTAVLLGGSTAFGLFSTSDATTLASQFSARSQYNFVNRNAPSWNSHQELVALTKFNEAYSLSISLSGTNDVVYSCRNIRLNHVGFTDEMQSFDRLSQYFNDLQGAPIKQVEVRPNLLEQWFPQTTKFWRSFSEVPGQVKAENNFCGDPNDIDLIVKGFLQNQKTMRQLSEARGAKHWLVLQPMYSLHQKAKGNKRGADEISTRRIFVQKVMSSDFCKTGCLDFSSIFDSTDAECLLCNDDGAVKWKDALFVDEVHLTDRGVNYLTSALIDGTHITVSAPAPFDPARSLRNDGNVVAR